MDKIKPVTWFLISFFILMTFAFIIIKNGNENRQKMILVRETRKELNHLMLDIYQAKKGSFNGIPTDGLWHKVRETQAASNFDEVQMRRQMIAPDILEVQIKSQKDMSLTFNFKVRIH